MQVHCMLRDNARESSESSQTTRSTNANCDKFTYEQHVTTGTKGAVNCLGTTRILPIICVRSPVEIAAKKTNSVRLRTVHVVLVLYILVLYYVLLIRARLPCGSSVVDRQGIFQISAAAAMTVSFSSSSLARLPTTMTTN